MSHNKTFPCSGLMMHHKFQDKHVSTSSDCGDNPSGSVLKGSIIMRLSWIGGTVLVEIAFSTKQNTCLRSWFVVPLLLQYDAGQRQKAVSAYFTSKQILPFGLAEHCRG